MRDDERWPSFHPRAVLGIDAYRAERRRGAGRDGRGLEARRDRSILTKTLLRGRTACSRARKGRPAAPSSPTFSTPRRGSAEPASTWSRSTYRWRGMRSPGAENATRLSRLSMEPGLPARIRRAPNGQARSATPYGPAPRRWALGRQPARPCQRLDSRVRRRGGDGRRGSA